MLCQNCGNILPEDSVFRNQTTDNDDSILVYATGSCDYCCLITTKECTNVDGDGDLVLLEQEDLDYLIDYETFKEQFYRSTAGDY